MSRSRFFEEVYADGPDAGGAAFYDRWAQGYDSAVSGAGYATPDRVAAALVEAGADLSAPLLDYGCGTGLSGEALRAAGFRTIDGWDVSRGMLDEAAEKGVYRRLDLIDPDDADFAPVGAYAAVAAIGVIGAGAAPASVFDGVMRALPSGGLFAFSFNDHTLEDPSFEARVLDWIDCGAADLLSKAHGDHLPALDLGAMVYVLRKR